MKNSKILNVFVPPFSTEYQYLLPAELEKTIKIGDRLEINFNNQIKTAYASKILAKSDIKPKYKLKSISKSCKSHNCFNNNMLEFYSWIADYYQEPLSNVLETAIPKYHAPKENFIVKAIVKDPSLRGPLQSSVFRYIASQPEGFERKKIINKFPTARPVLKKLQDKGYIEIVGNPEEPAIMGATKDWAKSEVELNDQQKQAFQKVMQSFDSQEFASFLLYGVTGSGKTEVYLELCNQVLASGKSVMLIVPEIALTPQLVDRFAARLKVPFALLHSGLSNRERWYYWQSLLVGKFKAVIGVRSAIFAPLENLGLIIVDEEHDGSYKQSEHFRYQARDLAVKRAQLNNAPIVMGSATPTLESIYNVKKNKYHLLKLSKKHSKTEKNKISVIDLSKLKKKDYVSKNISKTLYEKIKEKLSQQEQIFILYNRRGFASYLQCEDCQSTIHCPDCNITLTYYKTNKSLLCHYCGHRSFIPANCKNCEEEDSELHNSETKWELRGAGTEKIDLELKKLFPKAKIARLDRDLVTQADQYREILSSVRNNKIDILIGTQMIAKGHDLPNVTLVGVIDCDVGLNLPDFRASEKVFQLLTQVAGRAGRGDSPGEVMFQTRAAKHPSIVFAAQDDYEGFVNYELNQRKLLNYSPFSKLLRVIVSSTDPKLAEQYLDQVFPVLKKYITDREMNISLLGPTPAPINKLRQHWRQHILFKSKKTNELQELIKFFQDQKQKQKKLRIAIDLDPNDLM